MRSTRPSPPQLGPTESTRQEAESETSNLAKEEGEDSDEGPSHSATASEEMVARLSPLSMQGTAAEEETPIWQTREIRRLQATSSIRTRQQKVHSPEDAFLNHANRHVAFCHSILPMLEDLPFQRSMQATDDIYGYLAACRSAYRENLPATQMIISTPATTSHLPPTLQTIPPPVCTPSHTVVLQIAIILHPTPHPPRHPVPL